MRTAARHGAGHFSVPPVIAIGVVLLVSAFALGYLVCDQGWYRPVMQFLRTSISAPEFALPALFKRSEIPVLYMDIAFDDYQYLVEQRARALELGAYRVDGDSSVPAVATAAQASPVAVTISLLEGPAQVFADNSWAFQITANADEALLGVRWATLVPVDVDALLTSGYLEALHQDGFAVPAYSFVNLTINGHPWGLYAFEELPSLSLLDDHADNSKSVLVFFDSEDFLTASIELGEAPLVESFAYAEVAMATSRGLSREQRSEGLRNDDALAVLEHEAFDSLMALMDGSLPPSAVFDPEQMGRFWAHTTFWRGTPFLDWSTLCLAYSSETRHFEPIGNGYSSIPGTALPKLFLNDPQIQHAYVRELSRFRSAVDLPALASADLETLYLSMGVDLGYPVSFKQLIEARRAWIQHFLTPSQTVRAEVVNLGDALTVNLANLQSLPVEVLGLDLGENAFLPLDPAWVDANDQSALVDTSGNLVLRALSGDIPRFLTLRIPHDLLPQAQGEIRLATRLWGMEEGVTFVVVKDGISE